MTDKEINEFIAKKITKVPVCTHNTIEGVIHTDSYSDLGLVCERGCGGTSLPHYSTDIRNAFSILEEVKGKQIRISNISINEKKWYVAIDLISAKAETLPMAICRAAIKYYKTKRK